MMNHSRIYHAGLVTVIAGLALVAATLPVTSAAQDDQPAVNIIEPSPTDVLKWGYDNANLTISAGQTVTWTNTGSQQHTVTARHVAGFRPDR